MVLNQISPSSADSGAVAETVIEASPPLPPPPKATPFTVTDPDKFKSPSVDILATILLLSFLNSIKLGVAP
jgi:hypothetical protein